MIPSLCNIVEGLKGAGSVRSNNKLLYCTEASTNSYRLIACACISTKELGSDTAQVLNVPAIRVSAIRDVARNVIHSNSKSFSVLQLRCTAVGPLWVVVPQA
mmetsp:Transcript_17861/g.31581  ORF Transcript_17861/g.31581 Transcript_17861/m.31581 type:complete len:102 (-) Transcript_17861:2722-3027(-)